MRCYRMYLTWWLGMICAAIVATASSAEVIRVNRASRHDGPGDDWSHAYRSVQTGLNAASPGDEVWVAEGVYNETIILRSGVGLYGGFAGDEKERDDSRNPHARPTVLDGGGKADSVVTVPEGADSSTTIEGFTITRGTGKLISEHGRLFRCGGGVFCRKAAVRILRNIIIENQVTSRDLAAGERDNAHGGGIYLSASKGTVIRNNVIARNSAWVAGSVMAKHGSSCEVRSNTIASNTTDGRRFGGAVLVESSVAEVAGNIMAFNTSGLAKLGESTLTLGRNCVYNAQFDYSGMPVPRDDIRADPMFVDAGNGDFRLRDGSQAIDAGDENDLSGVDAGGRERVSGRRVDLGANEWHGEMTSADAPHVIADCARSYERVSEYVYGHNLSQQPSASYTWDLRTDSIKAEALPVLREAMSNRIGSLRFPGGEFGDYYRWRAGVGPRHARPKTRGIDIRHRTGFSNEFGTDEFISFTRQVAPAGSRGRPMMIVNWLTFRNARNIGGGAAEAAHWVEYCNGRVTEEILATARRSGWRPSRYIDPKHASSHNPPEYLGPPADGDYWGWDRYDYDTRTPGVQPYPDPAEWADGKTCWRADDARAPAGYFAWLRRYFAWQNAGSPLDEEGNSTWWDLTEFEETSYGAPYDIGYWEIGNEVDLDGATAEEYREHVMAYSTALKHADSRVRIGAVIAGDYGAGTGSWGRALLADPWGKSVDFLIPHLYSAVQDYRYRKQLVWADPAVPGEERGGPVEPTLRNLEAGTYTFYVRAKATPASGVYPRMQAWLLSPAHGKIPLIHDDDDPRSYHHNDPAAGRHNEYTVSDPKFTVYGDGSSTRTDYKFTVVLERGGDYQPWFQMSYDPGDPAGIDIQLVSYAPGDPPSRQESLVKLMPDDKHQRAIMAAGCVQSDNLRKLNAFGKEICVTEYAVLGDGWPYGNQIRDLKHAIAATDILKEMIGAGVSTANFWETNCGYSQIAQMKEPNDAQPDWKYDPIKELYYSYDTNKYLPSALQRVFVLLTRYFGDYRLPTRVTAAVDEFNSDGWGDPVKTGVPYLSALASGTGWADGHYGKISILVINKDLERDRKWTIRLDNVTADPARIVSHTLTSWNGDDPTSDPDAMNDYKHQDRVSIRTSTAPLPDWDGKTHPEITHTFPACSATVLEVYL